MRWWRLSVIVFSFIFCFSIAWAEDQPQTPTNNQEDIIRAVAPAENAEVIGKKPDIKVEFLKPVESGTLVVLLDGADITQLLDVTDKGFEFSPIMVLPAGAHNISITVNDQSGNQLQKNVSFTTRHTKMFEEAFTSNETSLIYETILSDPDRYPEIPDSRVEGNLSSNTKIKEKGWEFSFNTNLRYFDQNRPVMTPLEKGLNVANWLAAGSYTKDALRFNANIGDVQVNETQYTVSGLARRGGVLNMEYGDYQINMFSVKSEQVFGFKGGIGIESSTDDHIIGVSGGAKLFDKRVTFKTIYVTGGEPGSSFGISTTQGAKKGDVLGFLLTSDLLENKLKTEFEAGFSDYDPDTSDEFNSKSDHAYRIKAGGNLGFYNYDATYEYIGRDYTSIASQGVAKDREGVTLVNGMYLGVHGINLMLSRYNDNVKGDDLFPRIVSYQGNLDYSFNGIQNLPMGLSYQKSIQDSSREPEGSYPIELYMDTISGRVNYSMDKINLGFQTSYSKMDDRTSTNNDTSTITYTLTSSYNIPNISVSPAFSLNQSKIHTTGVRTDTYTINLDLRTKFLREMASFDVGGTYNITKANDDSIDMRNLNVSFRLAYNIKKLLKGFLNPAIALRGSYMKLTDDINSRSNRDEFLLFLVLTTTIPFSL